MATDIIQANWSTIKSKVKQKWSKLTDQDLSSMTGSFGELEAKLQDLYGYQQSQAKTEIETFIRQNNLKAKETTL